MDRTDLIIDLKDYAPDLDSADAILLEFCLPFNQSEVSDLIEAAESGVDFINAVEARAIERDLGDTPGAARMAKFQTAAARRVFRMFAAELIEEFGTDLHPINFQDAGRRPSGIRAAARDSTRHARPFAQSMCERGRFRSIDKI